MAKNHVGEKFGLLTVIEKAITTSKHDKWHCVCECGKKSTPFGFSLRSGETKSCGCVAANKSKERWKNASKEDRLKLGEKSKTHGMSKHHAYQSWADMRQRCNNKKHKWYPSYGGRGINVCAEWESFEKFWQDMGELWFPKAQIGRLDNNIGYSKENCRWETALQQQNNKSNSRFIMTPDGELTMSQAARKYGVSFGCLLYRINAGYPEDQLFKKSQRSHDKL